MNKSEKQIYPISSLNNFLKKYSQTIKNLFKDKIFYLEAEINSVSFKNETCYLYLIESDANSILARCSAVIFKDELLEIRYNNIEYSLYNI